MTYTVWPVVSALYYTRYGSYDEVIHILRRQKPHDNEIFITFWIISYVKHLTLLYQVRYYNRMVMNDLRFWEDNDNVIAFSEKGVKRVKIEQIDQRRKWAIPQMQ